ncbi:MAG: Xaa-Pro dipeptidyl-peptidase [Planctomycetota bacterium]
MPRLAFFAPFSFFAAVLSLAAQDPAPAKAAPVFVDGQAQKVDAFADKKQWIQEFLFVEADFDSDTDGHMDRLHVDVWRPRQTQTEGLKVPVVYETSPYFSGTGPMNTNYYWPVQQELGAAPPERKPMAPIEWVGKAGMISDSEVTRWLPRGFAVVHSCSPGTGMSQGCATVGGENERQAPRCVIDWLCGRRKAFKTLDGSEEVKADWCTGKVGMLGTSYNGTLPIACATTGVEGLMAIIPSAPAVSWYGYYRSFGLVRNPGGYPGEDLDVLYDFIASGEPTRRAWCTEHVRDGVLQKNQDRASGDYTAFWAERDYLQKLANYRAATLCVHGLGDWNVMPAQSLDLYVALKQKGVPAMVFLHQGGHMPAAPFELQNRWFTHFLYGVENGVDQEAKSWVVREGARPSGATQYPDYPHPEAQAVTVYLHGGGNGLGTLGTAPKADAGKEVLVDDPTQPAKALAKAEQSDNRLLYALPKLTAPLHLSGKARVTIRLAADKPACNLSVYLVSLPWTDARRATDDLITRGWADPQNHASLQKGEPLVPGTFYDVTFELQPDDQILPAGEQLGVMIFASDREFTLLPPGGTALTVDLAGTKVELPIVGGAAALARATAPAPTESR